MTRFARWVVVVTMYGAVFGTAGDAVGESVGAFDSGTCFGAGSCACGYVCVSGYCAYRGADDAPAECATDTDCRPECADRVCVARRCVARSSVDDSGTGLLPPPTDRPATGEDRVVDATTARDDGARPDGNAEPPWDRPTVARDVPPPPPLDRDAGSVDVPTVTTDAGSTDSDAETPDGSTGPETTGTVVQGCGCAVTGATTARPWWALGLVAWGLRRRRRWAAARGR